MEYPALEVATRPTFANLQPKCRHTCTTSDLALSPSILLRTIRLDHQDLKTCGTKAASTVSLGLDSLYNIYHVNVYMIIIDNIILT